MKAKDLNGVVIRNSGARAECRRCGAFVQVTLPMSVKSWLQVMKAFTKEHKQCPEQKTKAG